MERQWSEGEACREQISEVLARKPDVVALQEITRSSFGEWMAALSDQGYSVASTIDLAALAHPGTLDWPEPLPDGYKRKGPRERKYFNLTAAKSQIAVLPGLVFEDPEQARIAFPEKYLVVRVDVHDARVDVHNAHVPDAATMGGLVKVPAYQAIRRRIDAPDMQHLLLCGDFNCQRFDEEHPGGRPRHRSTWKRRWDDAEASVTEHPDLYDAFRAHRAAAGVDGPIPPSHYVGRNRKPKRYDHVFSNRRLSVARCRYLSDWLERDLSDHAAVEADFLLHPTGQQRGASRG